MVNPEEADQFKIVPLKVAEREIILKTLTAMNGNRTHAARALGISIRTLRNKLEIYARQGCEIPGGRLGPGMVPNRLKDEPPSAGLEESV